MTSVELFHIYTNEDIDKEKIDSVNIYLQNKDHIETNHTINVLIDDYSTELFSLITKPVKNNIDSVKDILGNLNIRPNLILYESYLVPICYQVLNDISNKEKKHYLRLIEKNKQVPCSLFVLAWYLLRLGKYKSNYINIEPADKIINILPIRYKDIDDIVLKVIKRSNNLLGYFNKIESIYFESDNDNYRPKN